MIFGYYFHLQRLNYVECFTLYKIVFTGVLADESPTDLTCIEFSVPTN